MEPVERVLDHLEIGFDAEQWSQLSKYRRWLVDEAHPAGGIGPHELDRLESRHLADSLLFAGSVAEATTVWDLGSGVGLPGIPLAIAKPNTSFTLIDRSGRRVDLANRAIRVLGLENCTVKQGEIAKLVGRADAVVARASIQPDDIATVATGVLSSGGVAVVGGSWVSRPTFPGWTTIEIPPDVLDQPIWLLMMRQQ